MEVNMVVHTIKSEIGTNNHKKSGFDFAVGVRKREVEGGGVLQGR